MKKFIVIAMVILSILILGLGGLGSGVAHPSLRTTHFSSASSTAPSTYIKSYFFVFHQNQAASLSSYMTSQIELLNLSASTYGFNGNDSNFEFVYPGTSQIIPAFRQNPGSATVQVYINANLTLTKNVVQMNVYPTTCNVLSSVNGGNGYYYYQGGFGAAPEEAGYYVFQAFHEFGTAFSSSYNSLHLDYSGATSSKIANYTDYSAEVENFGASLPYFSFSTMYDLLGYQVVAGNTMPIMSDTYNTYNQVLLGVKIGSGFYGLNGGQSVDQFVNGTTTTNFNVTLFNHIGLNSVYLQFQSQAYDPNIWSAGNSTARDSGKTAFNVNTSIEVCDGVGNVGSSTAGMTDLFLFNYLGELPYDVYQNQTQNCYLLLFLQYPNGDTYNGPDETVSATFQVHYVFDGSTYYITKTLVFQSGSPNQIVTFNVYPFLTNYWNLTDWSPFIGSSYLVSPQAFSGTIANNPDVIFNMITGTTVHLDFFYPGKNWYLPGSYFTVVNSYKGEYYNLTLSIGFNASNEVSGTFQGQNGTWVNFTEPDMPDYNVQTSIIPDVFSISYVYQNVTSKATAGGTFTQTYASGETEVDVIGMNPSSAPTQTPIAPIIPHLSGTSLIYIQIAFIGAILAIAISVSGILREKNPRPVFLMILFVGTFMGYTFQLISLQWVASLVLIMVFLLVMIFAKFARNT